MSKHTKVFTAQVLIESRSPSKARLLFDLSAQKKLSLNLRDYSEDDGYEFLVYLFADTREDCVERLKQYGLEGTGVVIRS
jgi:NADH:ubiquinone oxidoreductase subunit F (NADH-binding)